MEFQLHSISWNLTRRCNLRCAHCYLDASSPEEEAQGELSTEECLRTLDQIARVNPHPFLILTGGEPLLREDLFEIAHYAACRGFTVVVGTNGTLIDAAVARQMARHQIQGASISLDSPEPSPHDLFRGVSGAWEGAIRGAEALKEEALGWLAEAQKANGPGLLISARCAPHYRRVLYQRGAPPSRWRAYAGGCPAGTHYCRITPEGEVTPCPYLPLSAGSLREREFAELWWQGEIFGRLRGRGREGRCGRCEFRALCGGCRARAYAFSGNCLGEDPWCLHRPGSSGGQEVLLPEEETLGLESEFALRWTAEARERLERVPSFARGMVIRVVERFARETGWTVVSPEIMRRAKKR
ncbi:MAG: radical SAM protein [Nitrospinae bacterium]|nr:radical SAM protein [Nitrospinota bacterium]